MQQMILTTDVDGILGKYVPHNRLLYGEANCSLRERHDMITAVLLAAIYALPHAVYYKLLLNAAEYATQLTALSACICCLDVTV